jgi:mycothiol synthase
MTLPPGYSLRRPRPEDAEAVATVMTAADEAAEEVTAADVKREWHELDLDNDVWLVASGNAVVAAAGLLKRADDRVASEAYVDPEHRGRGLGSALLTLIEKRAQELAPRARLGNGALVSNDAAIALLEQRGYHPVRHFYRMTIDLREPPPQPRWPVGLEPRPFGRKHAEAFHNASQEAFAEEWGHRPRTFEDFLRHRVEAPGASLDLWLGVWDGDEIAATMICDARRYGMGWIASLGVRPAWRRRGLGLALLHHAFGEFWRRGERTIGLGVDAENSTGATRLYERAGMRAVFEAVVYEKQLGV